MQNGWTLTTFFARRWPKTRPGGEGLKKDHLTASDVAETLFLHALGRFRQYKECNCFPGNFPPACPGYNENLQVEGWFGQLADLDQNHPYVRQKLLEYVTYRSLSRPFEFNSSNQASPRQAEWNPHKSSSKSLKALDVHFRESSYGTAVMPELFHELRFHQLR